MANTREIIDELTSGEYDRFYIVCSILVAVFGILVLYITIMANEERNIYIGPVFDLRMYNPTTIRSGPYV